jgi:Fe2+ or Zn2+ uptake regulation protein
MMKVKQKLAEAGYNITAPRLAVLKYLSSTHTLISARDLHKKIKTVDLASIYRTLNLLEELQVVNVEMVNKEKLYCLAGEPHHHMICRKCGHIEVIKCNHRFNNLKNFTDIYHQMTLTGICNKCIY